MNKHLKKILLVSMSALMLASVGTGISSMNQSNVHASYRTSRIARLKKERANDYKSIRRINSEINRLERQNRVHKSRRARNHKAHRNYRRNNKRHAIKRLRNRKRVIKRHVQKINHQSNSDNFVTKPVHHSHKVTPQEPYYLYLKHHSNDIYNNNINTNNNFAMGYNDAIDNNNGNTPMSYQNANTYGTGNLEEMTILNTKYANNHDYKAGWIIGGATGSVDAGTADGNWGSATNGSNTDYKFIANKYNQGLTYANNNNAKLIYLQAGVWHNVKDITY